MRSRVPLRVSEPERNARCVRCLVHSVSLLARRAGRKRQGRAAPEVRYVVVDDPNRARYLDLETAGIFSPKRILLPIGLARLTPPARVVEIPG